MQIYLEMFQTTSHSMGLQHLINIEFEIIESTAYSACSGKGRLNRTWYLYMLAAITVLL